MGRQQGKRQSMANEVRDEYAAGELLTRSCATRTCAHCGERPASREGYDSEDARWYAVCLDCSLRVPDPPMTPAPFVSSAGMLGASDLERTRARRAQALAGGFCPVCFARPSRDHETTTCEPCLEVRRRRKAVPK